MAKGKIGNDEGVGIILDDEIEELKKNYYKFFLFSPPKLILFQDKILDDESIATKKGSKHVSLAEKKGYLAPFQVIVIPSLRY